MSASTIRKGTYGRSIDPKLQVVPDSSTDLTATDTLLYSMYVSNVTGGTVSLQVLDKQSVPREVIPTTSIGPHQILSAEWLDGIVCPGGVTWVASAADSLQAAVTGTYKVSPNS